MTRNGNEPAEVTIKPAKGRPMLQWVGKRPLKRLTAFAVKITDMLDEEVLVTKDV